MRVGYSVRIRNDVDGRRDVGHIGRSSSPPIQEPIAMSLSVQGWKKILSSPKNLGLKETGVSKALMDCQVAMNEHVKDVLDKGNREKVKKAFLAVGPKCDEVIKKHEKKFVDACRYLKAVKETAGESLKQFKDAEITYATIAAAKTRLKDLVEKLKAATGKDVQKILGEMDTNLMRAAKSTSKFMPFVNDFRAMKESWEIAKSGQNISAQVAKTLKPAIEFTIKKK